MNHQWSSTCPVCAELHCNKAECRRILHGVHEAMPVIDWDDE